MRVAVLWPKPRRGRIDAAAREPASHPDPSDGLCHLEREGIAVAIEDPHRFPLNPLARAHEVFCGLDPLRALRVARRRPPYDAVIAIGSSSAWFTDRFLRLFRRPAPVIMIDPAVGPWKLRRRVQDRIIPRVARVVVFGRAQLDHLREHYGDRVKPVFVHHRADVRFYDPATPALGTPPREPYVLAIGDDVSRDFDTLVRACGADRPLGKLLADRGARCVIHTRRELGALPPRVERSRRSLSHVELRDLYRDAAAVVLPLHDLVHAGGVNSLVEAMAMARPLVVSRSRGLADYVQDGVTAVAVAPGDGDGLGAAVAGLLSDPARAAALGAAARDFVTRTCAGPVYAAQLASVIRDAILETSRARA
jgi:glycosyltransferase involved in cell wall biosynthesis